MIKIPSIETIVILARMSNGNVHQILLDPVDTKETMGWISMLHIARHGSVRLMETPLDIEIISPVKKAKKKAGAAKK